MGNALCSQGASSHGAEGLEVSVPATVTPDWVLSLQKRLDRTTRNPEAELKTCVTQRALRTILERAEALFKAEGTLLEVNITNPKATVTVVGDTHGQFHDVLKMFGAAGYPSDRSYFIFNGDFVDRGAWGVETIVMLLAWKLALPQRVFLLRGNHETAGCTTFYGFKAELQAKYSKGTASGRAFSTEAYNRFKRLFTVLPLAAVVQHSTLVLHGGLYRQPTGLLRRKPGKRVDGTVEEAAELGVGCLADLAAATKGGFNPTDVGSSRLASDVLWSDPVPTPGLEFNSGRGVGTLFGPNVTEVFLRENNLKLVLRSHEGPDARGEREEMPPMTDGWTVDHDTPSGKLMTVFSAPDYPQFVYDETLRNNNKGAVAVLSAPDYATPRMITYDADLPRPKAEPYYSLDLHGSDDEFEPGESNTMGIHEEDDDEKGMGDSGLERH